MMRQFLAIKADHPDAILMYRMGDFYEMFMDDAERASAILDITLTTRDKGKADAVPMCGIPVHSVDGYVKRLTDAGCRVAICEQVEDPRKTKKIVKREVVEVVTPGLVGDPEALDGRQEVALVALYPCGAEGEAGLSALDVSTGDFRAARVPGGRPGALPPALIEELERIGPREVLLPEGSTPEQGAHRNSRRRSNSISRRSHGRGCPRPASTPVPLQNTRRVCGQTIETRAPALPQRSLPTWSRTNPSRSTRRDACAAMRSRMRWFSTPPRVSTSNCSRAARIGPAGAP